MKLKKIKFGIVLSVFIVGAMFVNTNKAQAFSLFGNDSGKSNLGELFILDKLFNNSKDEKSSLGDLFILSQLFNRTDSAVVTPNPVIPVTVVKPTIAQQSSGKILLQVEKNGEAWYVNPINNKRVSLGNPNQAFKKMSDLSTGITNADFDEFSNNGVPSRLVGKFLLKVEDSGKLYYVNPSNKKIISVGKTEDVLTFISKNSMGISNNDIEKIGISN